MQQYPVSRKSVEDLKGALFEELKFPQTASALRDYVNSVQSFNADPEPPASPAELVRVLKAGALFGGLLSATSRTKLLGLAEQGSEEARAALRGLVGTSAVYPGTFDPFTLGHADLVRRAVSLFDRVVVAIGVNPGKKPLFSAAERLELIRADLKDLGEKVEVLSFEGSLVSLARRLDCNVVLRGVRSVTDYEQELQLAMVNMTLSRGQVETLFIPAREGASFVSSTIVKSVIKVDEDASSMVSQGVLAALKAKRKEGLL